MDTTELDELQWKSPEWIQTFGLRTDNVLDYFAESPFFDKTSNNHVIKMQRQFSSTVPQQQQQQQSNNNNGNTSSNENNNGLVLPTGDNKNNADDNEDDNDNDRKRRRRAGGSGSSEFYYLDGMRQDIVNRYPIHASIERELSKLSGIEYVLLTVREPDFWVIRKQYRKRIENNNHMNMNMNMSRESMSMSMNQDKQFTFEILKDYYIVGANVYQSPSIYKVMKNRLMSTAFHLSRILKDMDSLTHFEPLQGVQFKQVVLQQQEKVSSNGNSGGSTGGGGVPVPVPVPVTTTTTTTPSIITNSSTAVTTTGNTSVVQSSPFDNNPHRETITAEMMDKLLTASMKSEPEYI